MPRPTSGRSDAGGTGLGGLTDEQLVLAAQAALPGDHRPFTELFRRYQAHVLANCRFLSEPRFAEDLAQEVFVKAYFGLATFERRSSFRTWLDRIKANHCLNHGAKQGLRDRHRAPLGAADLVGEDADQEHIPSRLDARRSVQEALEGLSPTLRVALVLSDMDGLPAAEIAETLGIGLSAAKMRIKRAREAFRTLYGGSEP